LAHMILVVPGTWQTYYWYIMAVIVIAVELNLNLPYLIYSLSTANCSIILTLLGPILSIFKEEYFRIWSKIKGYKPHLHLGKKRQRILGLNLMGTKNYNSDHQTDSYFGTDLPLWVCIGNGFIASWISIFDSR